MTLDEGLRAAVARGLTRSTVGAHGAAERERLLARIRELEQRLRAAGLDTSGKHRQTRR